MKYAIETNELTKKYGNFLAVDALDMKVKNKSIFGFLGPNGAGKTTSIKMLTCLTQPTFGSANVSGLDIKKNPNQVREKIGMVPQLVSLYSDLTARENVELCADYYGLTKDEKEDRIDDLMELVDIKYAENKLVKQMSGGQKQKVSVVASLIHRPDILFLDEPTIGLDPTTKMVLWDLIQELNDNGHTIILCSHDMYEVEKLCENIAIMNNGKLAAFDTPQKLKDNLMKEKEDLFIKSNPLLNELKDEVLFNNDSKISNSANSAISNSSDNILKEDLKKELDAYVPTTQLTLMAENINENIINEIKDLHNVYSVKYDDHGRITADIDQFSDNRGINNVIGIILKNQGLVTSISTNDPSLEDVFVDLTSKKYNKADVGE
ncbi:ATP-binding cassette domain-containing protein [Methanobrevibacter curvatus]|uniref:Daunorubicin/doxorubicin resistance ATP-binding protein DrrA n=1 Tax=Methanobrevibacter curvatus TaxID=49547 RepID=A0A166DHI1_9EURY|nr:ATP-binding cassette domain-containing protein [Methanobrevibacter curvatus]KZX15610.1 daunorubicin/doxorubicin resistance ATP-binding protein DrrA [Methanobrevibacter curvatus]